MSIGLVLDGGGGKGAYQLGVWKALRETGLDKHIVGISGTSVGGLNAALMVQGNYELAEKIWFEEIKTLKPTRIAMWVEETLKKCMDFSVFASSPIDCWLATKCVSSNISKIPCVDMDGSSIRKYQVQKVHYFNLRSLSKNECSQLLTENVLCKEVLLATCALPFLCKRRKIDGLRYRDGGFGIMKDNSPVKPLVEVPGFFGESSNCDAIIVVHLDQVENDHDPDLWNDVKLLQITPSVEMGGFFGGTLNFKPENTHRLAKAGYHDSLKLFRAYLNNLQRIESAHQLEAEKAENERQIQNKKLEALANIQRLKKVRNNKHD